jgi:pimeloyl-ACP methyl ester carboxylesterase
VVRLVAVAVVLLVLAGAGWMYWVWRHPLAAHEKKTRRALAALGLERMEQELAGERLVSWQGGEGPLLVLLHGAGDQAGTWAPVAGALLAEHRLLIPDLPGHGESEPADGPLAMDAIVAGLEALLQTQGADSRPVLVGNSMGAWLALLVAHRHPEGVGRVVAVNGGPLRGDPGSPSLVPADREAARQLMDLLRDPASPKIPDFVLDDIVRRSASGPIGRMLQDFPSLERHLLDGRLGEISRPVDLIWGASDRLMSLSYAERMLAELPRARLTEVERCGHIPQSECPRRFAETLLFVLGSDPPSGGSGSGPSTEPDRAQEEVSAIDPR